MSFSALSNKVSSSGTVIYLFILGVFFIFLADIPNLREDMVSAMLFGWGEQVTIKLVFELPPNDY
jgi:hypothetical protein